MVSQNLLTAPSQFNGLGRNTEHRIATASSFDEIPANSFTFVRYEFLPESDMLYNITKIENHAQLGDDLSRPPTNGRIALNGNIVFNLRNSYFDNFIRRFMRGTSISSTSTYTGTLDRPSPFFWNIRKGSGRVRIYTGCQIHGFNISVNNEGYCIASFPVVARDWYVISALTNRADFPTTDPILTFANVTVLLYRQPNVPEEVLRVHNLNVTYRTGFQPERFLLGSRTNSELVKNDVETIELEMEIDADEYILDLAIGNTSIDLQVNIQEGVSSGVSIRNGDFRLVSDTNIRNTNNHMRQTVRFVGRYEKTVVVISGL